MFLCANSKSQALSCIKQIIVSVEYLEVSKRNYKALSALDIPN